VVCLLPPLLLLLLLLYEQERKEEQSSEETVPAAIRAIFELITMVALQLNAVKLVLELMHVLIVLIFHLVTNKHPLMHHYML
jgi:hypothetical protein